MLALRLILLHMVVATEHGLRLLQFIIIERAELL